MTNAFTYKKYQIKRTKISNKNFHFIAPCLDLTNFH